MEKAETDPGVGLTGDLYEGTALRKNRGLSSLEDDLLHSGIEGKERLRENPGGDPPVKLLLVAHETTVVAGRAEDNVEPLETAEGRLLEEAEE